MGESIQSNWERCGLLHRTQRTCHVWSASHERALSREHLQQVSRSTAYLSSCCRRFHCERISIGLVYSAAPALWLVRYPPARSCFSRNPKRVIFEGSHELFEASISYTS